MLSTSYLFLGGAGAGMLVALCVLECLNARRRFGHRGDRTRLGRTFAGRAIGPLRTEPMRGSDGLRYFEGGYSQKEAEAACGRWSRGAVPRTFALPAEVFARSWPVCLVVLALGILCLIADLGRPDRLLVLALSPKLSAMTVGALALGFSFLVALVFFICANFDGFDLSATFVYTLSVVGIVVGLVCLLYTGVLLSGLASVLFWQTWLLPLVFALSSFSCGIALVFLAAAFVDVRQVMVRPLTELACVDGMLLTLEFVALIAYIAWGLLQEGTFEAAYSIVAGDLSAAFWGGVIVAGLVLPFAMERFIGHSSYRTQIVWIAVAILFGGLVLRFCIVEAGAYDMTQMTGALYKLSVNAGWYS